MTRKHAEPLATLLARRLTRRGVLASSGGVAASLLLPEVLWPSVGRSAGLAFASLAPASSDDVRVADGYRTDILVRWGDPLVAGAPALDAERVAAGALLAPDAAAAQETQFGYNCDGVGVFALDGREVLAVNHEYPGPAELFPGMSEAFRARSAAQFVMEHPQIVAYMQAAVGVSIVELAGAERAGYVADSRFNRRITATTPMMLAGPAAGHALLRTALDGSGEQALGTLANCAGGTTPWGTYLTAEENLENFFGNAGAATFEPAIAEAHRRLPLRARDSRYRWEYADPRFDVARHPAEALKFGWIVEIDPRPGAAPSKKRTALGRFKHEAATTVLAADGRVVIYMGDDEAFEYFYKFVSAARYDAARPERNRDLLDEGTLYVAHFDEAGGGEWRPLVWGEGPLTPANGFQSQGDVVLRCRAAADLVGATPLDRPEDVAVSPLTHKVYVSCTENLERRGGSADRAGRRIDAGADAVNPRSPNPAGHILEISEEADDAGARTFRWDILLLAGDPSSGPLITRMDFEGVALPAEATYWGGATHGVSAFAGPDNLAVDRRGNLWIVTDAKQPGGHTNGCFVCPTAGEERGQVRQFMSGPLGAEICGCEFSADASRLYLSIQHPGEGGSAVEPQSHWPDGGASAPRPSLIAIASEHGGELGS